jgi:MFS family permease
MQMDVTTTVSDARQRRKLPADVKRIAIVVVSGTIMSIPDGTIVTVALPSIQRDLGFSAANLSWVLDAFLIAFGSLLLLAGRLGDLSGRKRIFGCGLAVLPRRRWCAVFPPVRRC